MAVRAFFNFRGIKVCDGRLLLFFPGLVFFFLLTACVKFSAAPVSKAESTNTQSEQANSIKNKPLTIVPEQDPDGLLWGLRDTASGNLIMAYKYQQIFDFKEGHALVQLNGKFGLVNKAGKEIIAPEYDFPKTEMQCGFIAFEAGYGPIVVFDSTGKSLLPTASSVSSILPCQQRIAFSHNNYGLLSFSGDTILPFKFPQLFLVPEGLCIATKADQTGYNQLFGLYDLNGKQLLPHVFQYMDGFYSHRSIVKKDGKYGLIDETGKELFYTDYKRIDRFEDGYAKVYSGDDNGELKVGIIDVNGREVVPVRYQWLENFYNFREGLAVMGQDRKYGFLDTRGNVVIPFKYDRVETFRDGIAKVWRGWQYVGYINKRGQEIIPITFEAKDQANLRRYFDRFIIGEKDGLQHVFNYAGKEIATLAYDVLQAFQDERILFLAGKNNQYGLLDEKFQVKLPLEYESLRHFFEDKIVAQKYGKLGLINLQGQVLLPFEFEEIEQFQTNFVNTCQVVKNGKTGLLNGYGNIIVPPIYEEIADFSNGLAVVKREGKYGFIDTHGKEVIPVIYSNAKPYNGYIAEVTLKGETFEIDNTGERLEEEID